MKDPYIESLQELRGACQDLRRQAMETNFALGKVVNDSHLRSMLTLQKEDIGFKRMMELGARPYRHKQDGNNYF